MARHSYGGFSIVRISGAEIAAFISRDYAGRPLRYAVSKRAIFSVLAGANRPA
jgi:hypothetical protein